MSRVSAFMFALMVSAVLTGGLLAGCAPTGPAGDARTVNTATYKAVDAMLDKAGKALTKSTPMLVGTIGNVDDVETSSTLGRAISEEVSARLAQKGYRVAELKLRQGISVREGSINPGASGEYLLSRDVRDISGSHKAAVAVTGTYAVGAENVLVNLRLVDIRSGNVITAYDYVLPKNADVVHMTAPDADAPTSYFSRGLRY